MPRRKPAVAIMPPPRHQNPARAQPAPVLNWLEDYKQLQAKTSNPSPVEPLVRAYPALVTDPLPEPVTDALPDFRLREIVLPPPAPDKGASSRMRVVTNKKKRKGPRTKQLREIKFPPTDEDLVERVKDFLVTGYHNNGGRTPVFTSRVLAMLIQLHHRGIPAPTRQQLADYAGCKRWTIDNIMAAAMVRGLFTERVEVNVSYAMTKREGTRKEYFYVPSEAFLQAVDRTVSKVA